MKNIIIGTTFVDIKGFPESKYIPDGRNAGRIEYVHGGVGRNIAENLGRSGLSPLYISALDSSPLSVDIMQRLAASGVRTDYTVTAENGLGTWMAIFDDQGDVAANLSKRPDLSGIKEGLRQHEEEIFEGADNILVEIDMEADLIDTIMGYAGKYQLPVYAVISNMKLALDQDAFSYPIACLVCNRQEAEMMLAPDEADLSPAAMLALLEEKLPGLSIEKMVVTLGGEGAVYFDKTSGQSGAIPAVPTEVRDTTGAGDAFFSGVAIGLTEGKSLGEACVKGAEMSSLVISSMENVISYIEEGFEIPSA